MKFVLLLSLTLFSAGSFANEKHDAKEWDKKIDSQSLDESKKMMNEKLDKKEEMITTMKTCVNDAKDKAALKKCKKEHKATY